MRHRYFRRQNTISQNEYMIELSVSNIVFSNETGVGVVFDIGISHVSIA